VDLHRVFLESLAIEFIGVVNADLRQLDFLLVVGVG
jgi:hypothetical protein